MKFLGANSGVPMAGGGSGAFGCRLGVLKTIAA